MSEAKYAKGPWTQDQYGTVIDADGKDVLVHGLALTGRLNPVVAANTKLVTAAPYMYEALTDLLNAVDRFVTENEASPLNLADAIERARAAIKKATP